MAPGMRDIQHVFAAYCGPTRHYHGIAHIADMLQGAAEEGADGVQVWAIIFHDAIYDATRSDNEERSAAWAVEYLTGVLSDQDVRDVEQIILSTKTHKPLVERAALVIDLDLRPLAVDPKTFAHNTKLLSREFSHVSPEDFAAGTAKFAAAMLAHQQIYCTQAFRDRYEAAARRNLKTLVVE